MPWITERESEINWDRLQALMELTVAEARQRICRRPRRVLLLPPDITRMHSGAGRLAEILYQQLADEAEVHVIPTLGQHVPHTADDNRRMFGSIPQQCIHVHDWRDGCVGVGEIPAERVRDATGGVADWPIPIALNRLLMSEPWDLVINIGHVVPHEVLGFANHNKNYFIGLGGKDTICASHMAAACCGIENNLGRLVTPLRALFNWAEKQFLGLLPDVYVQMVMSGREEGAVSAENPCAALIHTGIYVGDDLDTYLAAARHSQEENITLFDEPVQKFVCVMQADEFHSTWVANKAIYRTRMSLADGGELIIIAPGLVRFGEQPDVDAIIRRYGYCGTPRVTELYRQCADLHNLAHAAAHLMHGSTEDRFRVTYAPGGLTPAEVESVGYEYSALADAVARYRPDASQAGWNTAADGEPYYFIPTPSIGLWATRERLNVCV
jgi:nickel-dependent lactate racemase